jgi:hypothetical protein
LFTRRFSCSPPNRGGLECYDACTPFWFGSIRKRSEIASRTKCYSSMATSLTRAVAHRSLRCDPFGFQSACVARRHGYRHILTSAQPGRRTSFRRHRELATFATNSGKRMCCNGSSVAQFELHDVTSKGSSNGAFEFGGAHRLVDSRLYPPPVQIRASGPSAQQAARAEDRQPEARSVPG